MKRLEPGVWSASRCRPRSVIGERVEGRKALAPAVAVHLAVFARQVHVGDAVVGFVNWQAARVGVVADDGSAAGCGKERLRKLRAVGVLLENRRKNPRFQPPGDGRGVGWVHQALAYEACDDGVLLRVRQAGP